MRRGERWAIAWLSIAAGIVAALVADETDVFDHSVFCGYGCYPETVALIGTLTAVGSAVVLAGLWKAAHAIATDKRAAVFAGLVALLTVLVTVVLVFGVD